MRITNFWFIIDDALLAASEVTVEDLTRIELPGSTQQVIDAVSQTLPRFELQFLKPPTYTLRSAYVRGEYHELVPLREKLQELEDELYPDFIVAGCWDYATGTPVGGVGSPWFVTPSQLIDFMPEAEFADRFFLAGQARRAFV